MHVLVCICSNVRLQNAEDLRDQPLYVRGYVYSLLTRELPKDHAGVQLPQEEQIAGCFWYFWEKELVSVLRQFYAPPSKSKSNGKNKGKSKKSKWR